MSDLTRRDILLAGAAGLTAFTANTTAAAEPTPEKPLRIGLISATIRGKPQTRNGHTWHFCQYLHPDFDWDAFKTVYPTAFESHQRVYRNPNYNFGTLPFPNTKITHYYDADAAAAADFCKVFQGCQAAKSVEQMANEVDAVWLGDASGYGDDHFDLLAPALQKGLPTFCDKPIGETPSGTKKILDFAKKHNAPLMSSSIFRHEFGMEAALRMRDTNEFGKIEFVTAALQSRYALPGWMIYGQHPVWTIMTLMGPGVEAVSMYEYNDTCHALITWPDKYPAHAWYGRPNEKYEYSHNTVHFQKKTYMFTPSIEGNFEYGHSYEMFSMARAFREMCLTRKEPVPHQEILEVTAIVHAAAKSLKEKSRLVTLAEVMNV